MKRKSVSRSGFYDLRISIGLFTFLCGVSLALFTMATQSNRTVGRGSNVGASTLARVTADGITTENFHTSERASGARAIPERHALGPLGNTLWQVDDQNTIADGVAIDANDVWGAWTLQGARLGAYPTAGNGTPDFEFSSFGSATQGSPPPREPIASLLWNRMLREPTSEYTASHPPAVAHRTGRFRFR